MTASPARSRLSVDERRDQLLRLGLDLFSRRPYDAVSIDEIAEAAGISRGLLYHYFPSKRDFYAEVVRAAVQELLELVDTVGQDATALGRLESGLRNFFAYARRRRHGFLTAIRGGVGADPQVQELTDGVRARIIELVLSGLDVPPQTEIVVMLRGWVGYVEGLVLAWLEHEDVPVDTLVAMATDTLATNLQRVGVDFPT